MAIVLPLRKARSGPTKIGGSHALSEGHETYQNKIGDCPARREREETTNQTICDIPALKKGKERPNIKSTIVLSFRDRKENGQTKQMTIVLPLGRWRNPANQKIGDVPALREMGRNGQTPNWR